MLNSKILFYFTLLYLFNFTVKCNSDDNDDVFVPTKDWKPIKSGQKIPKGLHVRINFETGLKEAKLLDEESSSQVLAITQEEHQEASPKPKNDKYTQYLDLQKAFRKLQPKTDAELLKELLKRHKKLAGTISSPNFDNKTQLLNVLEDLDYLVHQYDNAIEFVRQNGVHDVIYRNLNATDDEIKQETLRLLVSLTQNNAKPKVFVLESGAVAILLRLIALESSEVAKSRALTCLGALLRNFPPGQKSLLENGGLTVLAELFDADSVKIRLKIAVLVTDLENERKFAPKDGGDPYGGFDWSAFLNGRHWCAGLAKLLDDLVKIDPNDHDSIEKGLMAWKSSIDECGAHFSYELVILLREQYENLGEDEYFGDLGRLCNAILAKLHKIKTEL